MKKILRSLLPSFVLRAYHYSLAIVGALLYGFPSRRLFVVAVTGTKGKSSVVELIHTMFAEAGHKTASASTIRFRILDHSERNLFKMTMPGRFFLEQFLYRAVKAGCTHAVLEMTSEGASQFRHKGIALDALVFTNITPEHIESHGGFENYLAAKLSLAKHLEESPKRPRYSVANTDDERGSKFLDINVEHKASFSLTDAEPYKTDDSSVRFVWRGGEVFTVPLPGLFSLKNILAAVALGDAMGISPAVMRKAFEHQEPISGRAERVTRGQPFVVVVDYAHTPESLEALYSTYAKRRIIAVLGSTGGGRDKWKRPEMGKIADAFASSIILTNEDPYDEDPKKIIAEVAAGVSKHTPRIVYNRREAIHEALREAKESDVVLITGKGTDPFIMGPDGTKEVWSDKRVAEEELERLGFHG